VREASSLFPPSIAPHHGTSAALLSFVQDPPMPRTRTGFTLIELLIVVVIIGILAAIAIPKFQNTKGRANAAALRSDLRNLTVAQEAYFFEKAAYSNDTTTLNFRPSPGVQLPITTPATGEWMATATHPLSYPLRCVVYYGMASPPAPAQIEGVPACQ
jgi:prepilin-type N-terminal cleavage/methylation domain-containing protein